MTADAFWAPWESTASSYNELDDIISDVFKKWSAAGRQFAWRGLMNATWPLHSSLYRRLLWTRDALAPGGAPPTEEELYSEEDSILTNVHRWGLHNGPRGRLAVLEQLAMLQHFGAPTRLVDITFNPYIGLWFAVEKKYKDGVAEHDDVDGRLFAIDVTDRLVNEKDSHRTWEDDHRRPWRERSEDEDGAIRRREWCAKVFAWRPAPFERRIAAQQGGFLLGGVPQSSGADGSPRQWPKSTAAGNWWTIEEVRRCTSLALRVHKMDPQGGGVGAEAVYTIRIKANAKEEIRQRLTQLLGYQHSSLYPDFSGFASFGTLNLRERP